MIINNSLSFIVGCCIGSFINVIIYRLPIGESIVFPGSHCFNCNYNIRWYENIPIISWVFLRGKCISCNEKISLTYPFIELIVGFLFLLNNYSSPPRILEDSDLITLIFGSIFISILLILAILDYKYLWLPRSICNIGILLGVLLSLIITISYQNINDNYLILETLIALGLGYLIFQVISLIGLRIYKKPAMGIGDSKLAALLGSWLGIKGLGVSIWLSFILAGIFVIIGLISKKIRRDQKIPFGSFLALSGLLVWYFGADTFFNLIFLRS